MAPWTSSNYLKAFSVAPPSEPGPNQENYGARRTVVMESEQGQNNWFVISTL